MAFGYLAVYCKGINVIFNLIDFHYLKMGK